MAKYRAEAFKPRHRIQLTQRNSKGKRRLTVAGISAAAILTAAGVAVAVILYLLNITGTWSSANFLPQWVSSPAPSVVSSSGMTVSPSFVSSTTIDVDVANAHEGGTGLVAASARLQLGASESGRVVGVQGTIPAGWTVALENGTCGKTLPMAGTTAEVRFSITRGTGASVGGEVTDLALQVQPTSVVGTGTITCDPLTGT